MMNLRDRKEFLASLAQDYLVEKANNQVWQREPSSGYSMALGKLSGACTAFDYEMVDEGDCVHIKSRTKRRRTKTERVDDTDFVLTTLLTVRL